MRKFLIVLLSVSLLLSLLSVSVFASNQSPSDPDIPVEQGTYDIYPKLIYDINWQGKGNTTDYSSSMCLGTSPIINTPSFEYFKQNANGVNTVYWFGGLGTKLYRHYYGSPSQYQSTLMWKTVLSSAIPDSLQIGLTDSLTPRYNGSSENPQPFPIFRLVFDDVSKSSSGSSTPFIENVDYCTFTITMRGTAYDDEIIGSFNISTNIVISNTNMVYNNKYYNQYYLDLNEHIYNLIHDIYPEYSITDGIKWDRFVLTLQYFTESGVHYGEYTDFSLWETIPYSRQSYLNEVNYYNGLQADISYKDGYTQGENDTESFFMIVPNFLSGVIEPFLSFEIFPGFSITALFSVLIGGLCVLWLLKLIAGG